MELPEINAKLKRRFYYLQNRSRKREIYRENYNHRRKRRIKIKIHHEPIFKKALCQPFIVRDGFIILEF